VIEVGAAQVIGVVIAGSIDVVIASEAKQSATVVPLRNAWKETANGLLGADLLSAAPGSG
jgi:hypothetical protein